MKFDTYGTGIEVNNEAELVSTLRAYHELLSSGRMEFTGWVNLPGTAEKNLIEDILAAAAEIREKCTLCIVIGIGGSYLGARAVIDALDGSREGYPEIMFAGYNMSASHLDKVVKRMQREAVCLCVISKSGSTVEPLLSYSVLKEKLIEKYGKDEAGQRIYVITDKDNGALRREADENGYRAFDIPADIGGRYSVLSPVGLLPAAAAGHDIRALLKGAADIASDEGWGGSLLDYAVCRVALQEQGKCIEVFEYFESNLHYFGEWLKQLFCESEGKEGKGAFTTCLCFSRDIHSVGQFLQQGSRIFYETLIRVRETDYDFVIPESAGFPYAGKSLEAINDCSAGGVIEAHKKAGIPIMTVEIPCIDAYNMGQLIYFFEMSCALSAMAIGVNPFDQPGVEDYKREMRRLVEEL